VQPSAPPRPPRERRRLGLRRRKQPDLGAATP